MLHACRMLHLASCMLHVDYMLHLCCIAPPGGQSKTRAVGRGRGCASATVQHTCWIRAACCMLHACCMHAACSMLVNVTDCVACFIQLYTHRKLRVACCTLRVACCILRVACCMHIRFALYVACHIAGRLSLTCVRAHARASLRASVCSCNMHVASMQRECNVLQCECIRVTCCMHAACMQHACTVHAMCIRHAEHTPHKQHTTRDT